MHLFCNLDDLKTFPPRYGYLYKFHITDMIRSNIKLFRKEE